MDLTFLLEYDLSSQEGVVLMCLAEALLRIPDAATADALIADRLGAADWSAHLGHSESLLVNASTFGLMLTGRLVELDEVHARGVARILTGLAARLGEPVARAALRRAMGILAGQFILGADLETAVARAQRPQAACWRWSLDMLGEAALTADDAERYFDAYRRAIGAAASLAAPQAPLPAAPGVSVKLSALEPRLEPLAARRVLPRLVPRVAELAERARGAGVQLTVDAEESERLELTLAVLERVHLEAALGDAPAFGIAVQAYQKRAPAVIAWLARLAGRSGRRIPVRLVKGAYWDTEIKRAQQQGLSGYPVYTRKAHTDVAYLACARLLLEADGLLPQFATHNAHAVAHVLELAGDRAIEFRRLYGMGEALYRALLAREDQRVACRVYAPVGAYRDLLPYLIRRLLENGANTSFVHRLGDRNVPAATLAADPVALTELRGEALAHPRIPLPADLFAPERRNSAGVNLADPAELEPLLAAVSPAARRPLAAAPLTAGRAFDGETREVRDPADRRRLVGTVIEADARAVRAALDAACAAWTGWEALAADVRAATLERAADAFEARRAELLAAIVGESGRRFVAALAEVREAVDFLRYYAARCRADFSAPRSLPGPTGERNELALRGRGVFLCVSPWNFPLAIFTGQVAAALAAGNAVLAKPAEQTPLTAALATAILHEAGVPPDVLHLLPGDGPALGAAALADPRLAGVAFTGSLATAQCIQRALAARGGAPAVLIAETGGVNAMIADSSALPEQLVRDAVESAFDSAGQRCSALRLLYVQEDIAAHVLELLRGHMDELVIGDPAAPETDVGPIIDAPARAALERHLAALPRGALLHRCRLPQACAPGTFFAPALVALESGAALRTEVFGPVLHVVRFPGGAFDAVIDEVNASGYGLTLGLHSRIEGRAAHVAQRARCGNVYVNRNMIGSVVGVQPFGGEGRSGTGPKAGGPHYLPRFAAERVLTVNTAAVGGNAALLSLDDRASQP